MAIDDASTEASEALSAASSVAREMARAGLRDRHPGATDIEITQRLALITLGEDLTRRVYPDIDDLIDPPRP